jgi:hypothetical protein
VGVGIVVKDRARNGHDQERTAGAPSKPELVKHPVSLLPIYQK